MRADRRPDSVAKGRMRAASRGGGLIMDEVTEILNDFRRLNNEDARAAFADKWVRLAADRLEYTWPVLYELLRIIRDRKLYEVAERMEDRQARGSFEEYLEQVVRQPFEVWHELEETYHFVTKDRPELIKAKYQDANDARKRAVDEARNPSSLNPHGVKSKDRCRGNDVTSTPRYRGNSPDYLTARIARDRPDIIERMRAGEFKSVRAAAIEAGIIESTVIVPLDPVKAARRLKLHFDGDRLAALIAALQSEETP